ncbi:oligodendrocyte-myelin glycoprotein-like [Myxocyprinus asiaticus]|uniref:oligodendrocyte-myelin glycoprotein-like n=1 Tax=Myxocyprinus asiaticus TaxID=70543 RepID=UPI0022222E5D|nr:oligodendrocyte-myelin glycoprotein-like [Myxocyprinus asiaticus]
MPRIRNTLKMHLSAVLPCLLLMQFMCTEVYTECPTVCSCSESHRTVDCSWRGLRHLPMGLQRNIQSLNLTHNRLSDLDHHLSSFTHLRILDISYNRLLYFPASLPRALWEINVSGNRLHVLNKDDTAYHWNLRVLDLSINKLERVVFINNTLPNLKALNLSHNKFWTVPTNMPQNLEVVDLSHNTLVKILPGSLIRLARLVRFYLHANRFTTVSEGAFEHLQSLKLISLGDNPWACEEMANVSHLLEWTKHTSARVLGCPCHTWHTCGEAHLSRKESWHFGTYTLSPYVFGTEEQSYPSIQAVTTHFWSDPTLLNTHHTGIDQTASHSPEEQESFRHNLFFTLTSRVPYPNIHATRDVPVTTGNFFTSSEIMISTTRRTTTLRTRSVKRANQNLGRNTSSGRASSSFYTTISCMLLLIAMTQGF